jgi:hypothetical protein
MPNSGMSPVGEYHESQMEKRRMREKRNKVKKQQKFERGLL